MSAAEAEVQPVPATREVLCSAGCGLSVVVYVDQLPRPCEFCAAGTRAPVTKAARRELLEKRGQVASEKLKAVVDGVRARSGGYLGRCRHCRQPWVHDAVRGIVHAPGGCPVADAPRPIKRVPADDVLEGRTRGKARRL